MRITRTSSALGRLPALDRALSTGALSLDQVAAAAEFATPETDAELARVALGKAPSAISLAARTLAPPKVEDDQTLYERRALSMSWTPGRRELVLSGRLPLEQGAAFEQAIWNIAKPQRALDKQAGTILEWQQSAADALVTLARCGGSDGGARRSPTTLIVHLSDDAPPLLEGAGPLSVETADRLACDARRLTIKPQRPRSRALARRALRLLRAAARALQTLRRPLPVPRLHRHRASSRRTTSSQSSVGGSTELDNLILLCPRHHKLLHDHHIRTSGDGKRPVFEDEAGRAITTNQPHAPPC